MSYIGDPIVGVYMAYLLRRSDDRGYLTEVLSVDDSSFIGFGQAYVTHCYAGVVKAWHLHKVQWDCFFVVQGTMKIGLMDLREASPSYLDRAYVILGENGSCARLHIPPGVAHGFTPTTPEGGTVLNLPSESYNHEDPDEIRYPWDAFTGPEFWGTENR